VCRLETLHSSVRVVDWTWLVVVVDAYVCMYVCVCVVTPLSARQNASEQEGETQDDVEVVQKIPLIFQLSTRVENGVGLGLV
jgi:hypothetical protein